MHKRLHSTAFLQSLRTLATILVAKWFSVLFVFLFEFFLLASLRASESCHVFISYTFCKFILIFPHFLHKYFAYLANSMSRDKAVLGDNCAATARSSQQM